MYNSAASFFILLLFSAALYSLVNVKQPKPTTIISETNLFEEVDFNNLDGWNEDNHLDALTSFRRSCEKIKGYDDESDFKGFGKGIDWKRVCHKALNTDYFSSNEAKNYFETNFIPVRIKTEEKGLFTGYYAPLYKGAARQSDQFNIPLYGTPDDLQYLNLGQFDLSLKGKSIVGKVNNGQFIPYDDRKEIDQGLLNNRDLELVWVENLEDAFFLHIQGSGFIELDNGEKIHLGYSAKNGRPYRAIGQYLIQSGDIKREDMSMQAILKWIKDNPDKAQSLMWKNPSYVFFQVRKSAEPIGSLGVGLTAGRSLAIDPEFIPLGMPIWLVTDRVEDNNGQNSDQDPIISAHLRRLVVAQDTGGAIKGKVRGDVYWGIGDDAALIAGPMKDIGTYYLLVPKPFLAKQSEGTL
jgi:membrane-bound lytic murein transglycosylase A